MKEETNHVGEKIVIKDEGKENSILRCIAQGEGHLLIRRPRCMPFIMSAKEWEKMIDKFFGEKKE